MYLSGRERERKRAQAGAVTEGAVEGEGDAGSPLSREPNAGLDPRIPQL